MSFVKSKIEYVIVREYLQLCEVIDILHRIEVSLTTIYVSGLVIYKQRSGGVKIIEAPPPWHLLLVPNWWRNGLSDWESLSSSNFIKVTETCTMIAAWALGARD